MFLVSCMVLQVFAFFILIVCFVPTSARRTATRAAQSSRDNSDGKVGWQDAVVPSGAIPRGRFASAPFAVPFESTAQVEIVLAVIPSRSTPPYTSDGECTDKAASKS